MHRCNSVVTITKLPPPAGIGAAPSRNGSLLDKVLQLRIFGKSPAGAFLRMNDWTWNHLPGSLTNLRPVYWYGHFLHALVRRWGSRRQYFGTFFLRNRPQLELIRLLSCRAENASGLSMAVLGCSNGAEVYSILATLRSSRPELKVVMHAVDISKEVLEIAQKGAYSFAAPEPVGERIFQRMTAAEMRTTFDREAGQLVIQPWIKDGIIWHVGDVRLPETTKLLGPQDIVVANNFLCHMNPRDAETCLRGIARLVQPGGYLVVSGIDLNVRAKVATDQKWKPVTELLEEIHDGDSSLRRDWPMNYWGLEPLDTSRSNWVVRYATAFQINERRVQGS
jgi:chemotaxis methyl-accepting protein methylase